MLRTTQNIDEARKQIKKEIEASKKLGSLGKEIILLSQDDEFNRKAIEIKGLNMLLINEELGQRDYMKQRNSGLNEFLAKLAQKNNINIGIDIEHILNKSDVEKARALARLKQNLMLCKKAKAKLVFYTKDNNNPDKIALQALLLTLGADTGQASSS